MRGLRTALIVYGALIAECTRDTGPATYNLKLMGRTYVSKPKESWQGQGKRKKKPVR